MSNIVIFDIDGTLADCTHRLHHITPEANIASMMKFKPDWDAFHAECHLDVPKFDIIHLARLYSDNGFDIALCTGRMESNRQATIEWMVKHAVPFTDLRMRRQGDFRADYIVKKEMLDSLLIDHTIYNVHI